MKLKSIREYEILRDRVLEIQGELEELERELPVFAQESEYLLSNARDRLASVLGRAQTSLGRAVELELNKEKDC